MVLRLDDFAAFQANWNDKTHNLTEIASELSLGLDSFVFLDDNPLEREWVREQLPQVTVPECGCHPWEMLAALRRGRYFEAVTLTREDFDRHDLYRNSTARRELQRQAGSVEDFLAGLEMVAAHGPVDENTLARVAQLVSKTNQFNLTNRRRTESEIRAMSSSSEWWCQWFRLSDRFGNHGLIGVMFARAAPTAGALDWIVDTWLMSCRVLGRHMEHYMMRTLVDALRTRGASRVVGEYLPTTKNGLVQELYPQMGFVTDPERAGTFVADLAGGYLPPECPYIHTSTDTGTVR
jgi:FkbH-like protein